MREDSAEDLDQPAGETTSPGGDPLLDALARLREAEELRRQVPRESREFDDRVRDVEALAREVFRLAELDAVDDDPSDDERDFGDAVPR